jgi:hypothetical protein
MKFAVGLLVLLVIAGAIVYLSRSAPPERPAAPPVARTTPAPAAKPAETPAPPPAAAAPTPERKAAPRKAEPPAPAAPAAPAASTLATLVLDSDVAGASVFVNREYVGTTPLRLDKLEPGSKQLKLTADGYEGVERSVDLVAGDNAVTMRFKEVRLNKRLPVTHKHGVGGCEGTLVATVDGLAYETTNKNDAFVMPFAQVETFAVDYLEKNLRVKQRGGKTWNFTDKQGANADALFVFQRDVEAARKKLADGYAAVR